MRYSDYLRRRYGEKVYKLPVNLPVSCPNRDGSLGSGGCIFCGTTGAGFETLSSSLKVKEQIIANQNYIAPRYKAAKFIAYLQNFSNTYLPPETLQAYLEEACQPGIVALAISTRPDCINDQCLDLIAEVGVRNQVDITVEVGLQTVNYHTLNNINRGHTLAEFIDAALRVKKRDMTVCAHVILNLPGDDLTDVIETAKVLSAVGVDQVKLHALYVVKGTILAQKYEQGVLKLGDKDEYVERVIKFLEFLHPRIAVQRLIGRAPAADTLFANWGISWWKVKEEIEQQMQERKTYQGRLCDYLNGKAVRKFYYNEEI